MRIGTKSILFGVREFAGQGEGQGLTIFIGLDAGAKGAIVALRSDGKMRICRLDKTTEREQWEFLNGIAEKASWDNEPVYAVIEQIRPMPAFMGKGKGGDGEEQGTGMRGSIASMKIGQAYGFLRGLLIASGIPFEEVSAQKWQRAMGCLTGGDKRITRAKAQELFPNVKVIHVTADGILLSEYCHRIIMARK